MELTREQLIAYALECDGEYNLVLKLIAAKAPCKTYKECQAITIVDEDYPPALWLLQRPPLCLFYKGDRKLLTNTMVGIVGSRQPSSQALEETENIVKNLKFGYAILSGMAKGIDGAAHRAAIDQGRKTIGILANGIDYCYPENNNVLYQIMIQDHLVLSERPGLVRPQKRFFPFRNRLIAALAKAVIIPQANYKGGSMITADLALALNKEVYFLPRSLSEVECGNNFFIQQGANIISGWSDIRNI